MKVGSSATMEASSVSFVRTLASKGAEGDAARLAVATSAIARVGVRNDGESATRFLAQTLREWAEAVFTQIQSSLRGQAVCAGIECEDLDGDDLALFDDDDTRLASEDPDRFRVLWLDAALLRVLARFNRDEAIAARNRRVEGWGGPCRWDMWPVVDGVPVGLSIFASALWETLRAQWEMSRAMRPAFVRGLAHDCLFRLMSRPPKTGASHDGIVRDHRGGLIGRYDVAAVEPVVMKSGLGLLRGVIGHKLLRHLPLEAHQARLRGDTRPDQILIDGGFAGLAQQIGCNDSDACELRKLLIAGGHLTVSAPGLEIGGLWHWNLVEKPAPGQRSVLELVLNERVFLPGTSKEMKATGGSAREAKRARRLVPVLTSEPPHRLRNRAEWGLAWSVAFGAIVVLVDGAHDLAATGGVLFDDKKWRGLLYDVGLTADRLSALRTILLEGDGAAPPLLERVTPNRFTLAPAHSAERAFILARTKRKRPMDNTEDDS